MVKNQPAMQDTWIWTLDWEDPLEEGMATHSSVLAWRIPMDRVSWKATVHGGHKELDMTKWPSIAHQDDRWVKLSLVTLLPEILKKNE